MTADTGFPQGFKCVTLALAAARRAHAPEARVAGVTPAHDVVQP